MWLCFQKPGGRGPRGEGWGGLGTEARYITETMCCSDQKLLDSTLNRNYIFSFQAEEKVPSSLLPKCCLRNICPFFCQ